MSTPITDRDYIRIANYLAGEAGAEDRKALDEWRAAHSDNEAALKELERLYRNAALADTPPAFDGEREWQRLAERLSLTPIPSTATRTPHPAAGRFRSLRWMAAAAVAVLAASLFLWSPWNAEAVQTYQAARGDQSAVTLPDGSRILLNSDTRLTFREGADKRMATLDGEGYFAVAPEGRPFVVASGTSRVVVLGTRFAVNNRQGETRVVVESGRVALHPSGETAIAVELADGQMAQVSAAEDRPGIQPAPAALLAWIEGDLGFYHTPLPEIAAELSRRYNRTVQVRVSDPESHTVTGTFARQPLEKILTSICLALDLEYILEDGEITIVSR